MQLSLIRAGKLAELAQSAEKLGYQYVQVQSKNLLALGADPLNPTHVIDLTKEAIRPFSSTSSAPKVEIPPESTTGRASRRSGEYYIEVKGNKIRCMSLKEMLAAGLKALEKIRPGTLDRLSTIVPRSKRIVATDPGQLFKKPELVQKYSEKLIDGWWFGTNNSTDETLTWLRRAAEIAGLKWGNDIVTSIG